MKIGAEIFILEWVDSYIKETLTCKGLKMAWNHHHRWCSQTPNNAYNRRNRDRGCILRIPLVRQILESNSDQLEQQEALPQIPKHSGILLSLPPASLSAQSTSTMAEAHDCLCRDTLHRCTFHSCCNGCCMSSCLSSSSWNLVGRWWSQSILQVLSKLALALHKLTHNFQSLGILRSRLPSTNVCNI